MLEFLVRHQIRVRRCCHSSGRPSVTAFSLQAARLSAAAGPPRLCINSLECGSDAGFNPHQHRITAGCSAAFHAFFFLSSTAEGRGCASDHSSIFCSCHLLAVSCQLLISHSQSAVFFIFCFILQNRNFQSIPKRVRRCNVPRTEAGFLSVELRTTSQVVLSCWFRH